MVELFENGAIHRCALVQLRDRPTDENHAELLRDAARKNKREIERLLAARFPQPDAPSMIRKLARTGSQATTKLTALGPPSTEMPRPPAPPLASPVAPLKLLGALTGLGFRPKPTRAVLDLMLNGKGRVAWTGPLDELLREAAQLLTR
jgi:hypothetical protein